VYVICVHLLSLIVVNVGLISRPPETLLFKACSHYGADTRVSAHRVTQNVRVTVVILMIRSRLWLG